MAVDMNLLKDLRNTTHAPLKDCKDALEEANGDFNLAMELLKQKGLSKAAKKADRETNEGIVRARINGDMVVGIKLGCETDFAAKNEGFIALADRVLDIVQDYQSEVKSIAEFDQSVLDNKINPVIADAIGSIGENIRLLDVFVKRGKASIYNHMDLNKIVTVVFYEGEGDQVAKELALQITAMNPEFASIDDVPAETRATIRAEFVKELEGSNKPADIIEKIIDGKVSKAFEETVLMEQAYIRDDSKKIKHILPAGFKLVSYIRFAV